MVRVEIGMRTDGRDKPSGEVTPVADVCREQRADFAGAKFQQSVTEPRANASSSVRARAEARSRASSEAVKSK